jgi:cytochrome bd-type quinol oxidase subunit 2
LRIRVGEALTAVGAIGLFVLLFADWFSGGGTSRSGWSSLGWALIVLLAGVVGVAIVMVVATVVRAKPAIIVGSAVITTALAIVTLPIALIRVLITQPDLDLGLGNTAVDIKTAGWLGLVALVLIAVGAWTTLADERTSARESAYTPPPPRPVPGS